MMRKPRGKGCKGCRGCKSCRAKEVKRNIDSIIDKSIHKSEFSNLKSEF